MKLKALFFIAGIVLLIAKWRGFFVVHSGWVFLSFAIWLILTYISIHNKNKQSRTPRPVYMVNK